MNAVEQMQARVEKLSLEPYDLIIVRTEEDMVSLREMTEQGIGYSRYANPVLLIKGGLERATEDDLVDALKIVRSRTEEVSRIITKLN